ncbi:MAG: Ig-like domain-containing protein [Rubricoccaceae bacterium]|nr:Ig-like domain-containing protein [Rubricoccaceae bacterium]
MPVDGGRWTVDRTPSAGRPARRLRSAAHGLLIGALCAACATPVRPSGGPPDTTPPVLVGATPSEGATGVTADRLVLEFSERLDEASVAQALTVTPAFDARPPLGRRRAPQDRRGRVGRPPARPDGRGARGAERADQEAVGGRP